MKTNGNDMKKGDYYLGLDVGSSSVGWAVTDKDYNVLKYKGNAMWGVRLFEEAQNAAERRSSRTSRRRLERRKQRLALLEMLFANEVSKVDPDFFIRLHESGLWLEDKRTASKFSLFNDPSFTDREYHAKYPTVYHLRSALLHANETGETFDVRLVFLAIHHILKTRGHFLYELSDSSGEVASLAEEFEDFCAYLSDSFDISFEPADKKEYLSVMQRTDLGVSAKKKSLRSALGQKDTEDATVSIVAISDLLAGATVKLSDLFRDDSLKQAEVSGVCLKNDLDESFDVLSDILGERVSLLVQIKPVFDTARLHQILGGHAYISDAKVQLYEKNKADLRAFKDYVKRVAKEQYHHIFSEKKEKLCNYASYSRHDLTSGVSACKQDDFCKFLRSLKLPQPDEADTNMTRIFSEIENGSFLPRLRGGDNGVIPYQLHRRELVKVLDNASAFLPFLCEKDPDGLRVKDKIVKIMEFRVPYYVGPLNGASPRNWAVRFASHENEKIYPWNFAKVIDTEASAAAFMNQLIGRCTYTGEFVLPKDSLLYSEYTLLNELNPLRVNGQPLPVQVKHDLIRDLFVLSGKKVTKKGIRNYLLSKGLLSGNDELSGIDDAIKSKLRSRRDFDEILSKTHDLDMVEDIIRHILVFGKDKKMLTKWLKKNTHSLDEADIKHICRLNYSDWGSLSKVFLTDIYSGDEHGEAQSIMDMLRTTSYNLMQLLSSNFSFAENAAAYRNELFGNNQSLTDKLDSMYIAPAVRRSIRQTLRIVDEIVDIEKGVPAKIFIEMARGSKQELKGKRTESRKDKLMALYKSCGEQSSELFQRLEREDEGRLRRNALYLYYTQRGRCMYSGEEIDFDALSRGEKYDLDHIFPRSKIKDDSLDNLVLVKNTLNREKTNDYPINESIRTSMTPWWVSLKKAGLISEKKFDRLTRAYSLTSDELASFVARQLTQTQQSTKALTSLLQDRYGDRTRIIFSKAGNVSDFRHDFDIIKCRDVNDLHHAKDAYLNVVVGNVYCTKFTDRFFANIQNEKYSLRRVFDFDVPGAWAKGETIKTVKRYMSKNNVLVTRMARETRGALYDLQLVQAGKGQLPKKAGMDIDKYGGYNKLTGAYFFVVEHTDKKKRIRSIQPVYLFQKALYESDPITYCRSVLQLSDPVIICPKVLINALLELNGQRLFVTGRSDTRIRFEHAYQLAIDPHHEQYIKNIAKFVERQSAKSKRSSDSSDGEVAMVTEYDGISVAENMDLYEWFLNKSFQPVYADLLGVLHDDMSDNRDKFPEVSILDQCNILLEILKAFKCDSQLPNFKVLNGKGSVAGIRKSAKISGLASAYLIHQSVTGIYETKVDLLK